MLEATYCSKYTCYMPFCPSMPVQLVVRESLWNLADSIYRAASSTWSRKGWPCIESGLPKKWNAIKHQAVHRTLMWERPDPKRPAYYWAIRGRTELGLSWLDAPAAALKPVGSSPFSTPEATAAPPSCMHTILSSLKLVKF